jgi:hypothetical protein
MATTSTIPDVCEALVAHLAAANPGTQVEWGRPQDALIKRKTIYVGDVDGDSRIPTMKAGRKERDEQYTVDVLFVSAPPRGSRSTAARDVLAMYATLEDMVAGDPTLGGGVVTYSGYASGYSHLGGIDGVWAVTVDGYSLRPAPTGEAAAAVLACTVSVKARLV